jgi:phosphate transport system substrate-binding protein
VPPSPENIADGRYPLADGYYAVIHANLVPDHKARAIITWLQGEDGAKIIKNLGLIACP